MALGLVGSTCSRQTQCRASCLRLVVPAPLQRPFASAVGLRTCSGAVSQARLQHDISERQVHTNAFAGADFTDKPVPNAFWRAFAALIYIIPCIDTFTLGTTVYNIFPQMIVIAIAGSNFAPLYWSHQFAPLLVFFLVFLGIVKNRSLHHFVRFNAMQAMMLDICVMLPTVAQAYIPSEIAWTVVGRAFQGICFVAMATILIYSFVFTLAGKYADVTYVSDAVYMQVYQSDLM